MAHTAKSSNPGWWSEKHNSGWDNVKAAFHRDWEQTKADLSKKSGHELNQGIGDTVKQAVGKEPIPPGNVPNPPDWDDDAEHAYRFGWGARAQYPEHKTWDDKLDGKLRSEWDSLGSSAAWNERRLYVERGWRGL